MKTAIGRGLGAGPLFGPEMLEDPYPTYRQLRERDPVHRDEALRGWVLTRYEDVAWALGDGRLSSERVRLGRERFPDPSLGPLFDVLSLNLLQRDDPDHARLRALVQKAFMRASVQSWDGTVRRRVRALLDEGRRRGEMDFVRDFAVPLPILVISEIVGIPEDDRDRVKRWCDDFSIVALNFYANITPEQLRRGRESTAAFRAYLEQRVDALRSSPRNDLLSALVHVEEQGDRLSLDELLANTILLLNAGNETTTSLLGNGLSALLRHPEQLARVREDPSTLPLAIEEFLRFDSPVQFLGRIAAEDLGRGGKAIRRGDLVLAVIGAANRDPDQFPEPDRLDVARHPNQHLAFGHGRHFCVGAHLARLEGRLAFEALLAEGPAIEPADPAPRHHENFNMRGYRSLPIRFVGHNA